MTTYEMILICHNLQAEIEISTVIDSVSFKTTTTELLLFVRPSTPAQYKMTKEDKIVFKEQFFDRVGIPTYLNEKNLLRVKNPQDYFFLAGLRFRKEYLK